jgi:DNA helicase-2/ATP-dependent DNA helicase PcrA
MADLLADLTPDQIEAVTHMEGPMLILAGAGSGKTRVITRRVVYLLQAGVKPYQILAITFTNKAATEMRQRVDALVPNSRVWISTFHSLGARLLRQYADRLGLESNFTIYDQSDRNRIIKAALENSKLDSSRFTPDRIQAAISRAKNQLLSPEKYAAQANDFFMATVAGIYPIYDKKLRDANALDFDDLLFWPALALRHDPELRAELDARFCFVLIDEYQDTNKAQYAIARALSQDEPNLCVVGDPDQSIYGWRGADIKNILDFERDFPNAKVVTLERNYRSTKAILYAASHLIAQNRFRKPKNLVTENPQGKPVQILTFESGLDEAEGIAIRIRQAVEKSANKYRDFAVFLRVNALSRSLETAFVRQQVPYQIVRGLAFYERKENRDVLAYLRLLSNPRDDLSFLRIVNEPPRGIGKKSLEHLQEFAELRGISLLCAAGQVAGIPGIKGKAAAALRDFALTMQELGKNLDLPPDQVICQVLDNTGYRMMLKSSNDPEDEERLANIEELITAAKQFAAEEEKRTIHDFLESITLASDVDGWNDQQDCVSVMTLHSAKGLEFPVVFMTAVEQGLLPHERSGTNLAELEEERRLAFVGMTRAKEELFLCHARQREFRGSFRYAVPSIFLDELPTDGIARIDLSTGTAHTDPAVNEWRGGGPAAVAGWADAGIQLKTPNSEDVEPKLPSRGNNGKYSKGMLVSHAVYGKGKVTEVSGYGALEKIRVRFSTYGEKTFIAEKAKLAIL